MDGFRRSLLTSGPAEGPEELAVYRESLELRCTQAIQALIPMTGALLVVGALLWDRSSHGRLLTWLLGSFVATVIAAIDCWLFIGRIEDSNRETLERLNLRFFITTLLNTAAMGSGAWLVASVSSEGVAFFVTLCLCFYAIGHTINGFSHLGSFYSGLLVNLGQAIVFWLTQGEHRIGIAVMLAGIAYLLCTFARRSAQAFKDSVRMRFANLDLVNALSAEKLVVEAALNEAKEASLMKTRFLAAVSHDLRQPLSALSLWTGLLRESLTNSVSLERMEKVSLSVHSLNNLCSGLFDLSKLDGGGVTPELRSIRLQNVLDAVRNDIQKKAEAKGLELTVCETRVCVRSDPVWLERVLLNLVDNAVKYTPRGSVAVVCEELLDRVTISIVDTGIGIAEKDHTRIFEEYFQVHNSARDRALGVGLGLAIVKRACDLLGHSISLHSQLGVGSRFSLTLPKCQLDSEGHAGPDESVAGDGALEGLVVVVIEDDQDVMQAMSALLDDWRCTAVCCMTAEEAASVLSARQLVPNAVVADYRLADGLTGADAIAAMRRQFGDFPAALVTGEVDIDDLRSRYQSSYEVLQKPLNPPELRRLLLRLSLPR